MKTKPVYKSTDGKKTIINHYESILNQWPVPYETLNIKTKYGNTFIIACGDKSCDPIILLHGSSSNSAMWMGDVVKLSQKYRVYAVDIIGEPGKSDENRPDMKGTHYAKWIEEVFNTLNIDKAVIIGNSLGGWMALSFATYSPERIEKLVLLAPSGISQAKISFLFRALPLLFLGQKGTERLNRIVYGNQAIPKEALEFGNLIMRHYNPRVGSLPVFTDEELLKLTMPTLFLGGEKDALLPSKKAADRLNKLLSNVKTVVLKDTSHVLLDVVDEILSFL